MNIQTVGILSPGDMGHAIGAVLHQHGVHVISNVHDRSPRTQALAQAAGISAVPDDETLVREADILLSILSPAYQDDESDIFENDGGELNSCPAFFGWLPTLLYQPVKRNKAIFFSKCFYTM